MLDKWSIRLYKFRFRPGRYYVSCRKLLPLMAAIIFDFDGTIADSHDFLIKFMADKPGAKHLSVKDAHALYGLSPTALAKKLGYHWWGLPKLYFRSVAQMGRSISHIKPYDDMVGVINKLNHEGHELFIVSNNNLKNIRSFLSQHNLREKFVEVYGGIDLFGKAPIFREVMSDHNLDKDNVICVGDETRDIEASKSAGLKSIAVAWGFSSYEDLVNLKPTALAKRPDELVNLLNEL